MNPQEIVQGQLEAYNARDVEAFMTFWADDARMYEHPSKLLASGASEIRERHVARFAEANLHGKLINRMVQGGWVIDQELVTRTFPEGPGTIEVIAIYEVGDGKIVNAWFVFGPKKLSLA
ncbi:MAG: steroid delta-isomerase [Rhizobiaceae bacterium]|nr:MAG: steroid delta-isomerase [Rhizobiaceae bacterium]